jgi:hypothetical protein
MSLRPAYHLYRDPVFKKKKKKGITYDTAIPFLCSHPKVLKVESQRDIWCAADGLDVST